MPTTKYKTLLQRRSKSYKNAPKEKEPSATKKRSARKPAATAKSRKAVGLARKITKSGNTTTTKKPSAKRRAGLAATVKASTKSRPKGVKAPKVAAQQRKKTLRKHLRNITTGKVGRRMGGRK